MQFVPNGPDIPDNLLREHEDGDVVGRPLPQRGRPMLAEGEVAKRVIDRVTTLSQRYGTKLESRAGIGIIDLRDKAL